MKVLVLAVAAALASFTLLGCSLQQEGERCSPLAAEDCDTGLLCTQVIGDVYVCCPETGGTDPYCREGGVPTTSTTTTTTTTTTTGVGGAGGAGGAGGSDGAGGSGGAGGS